MSGGRREAESWIRDFAQLCWSDGAVWRDRARDQAELELAEDDDERPTPRSMGEDPPRALADCTALLAENGERVRLFHCKQAGEPGEEVDFAAEAAARAA